MCCLCTTCPKECPSQQLRDPTCQGTSVASGRQHLRGASLGLQGLASILRGHFLPESVCWGIADVAVPWAHKDPWTQHVDFFLFFLFFFFGLPVAYGIPRPGIRSELQLQTMPQLQQCVSLIHCAGLGSNLHPGTPEMPPIPLQHSRTSWTKCLEGCRALSPQQKVSLCVLW